MELYPLPDVAQKLDVPYKKVRQYIRDHKLLAMKNEDNITCVPELFLMAQGDKHELVDDVQGTANLLIDGGFSEEEACQWMISEQELLDGERPIDIIRTGGYHRVNRVASMMAF